VVPDGRSPARSRNGLLPDEGIKLMAERLTVFFDPGVFDHDTGTGFFEAVASSYLSVIEKHPENDDRLRNMYGVLQQGPIAEFIDWRQGEAASHADLEGFHTSSYIEMLASIPASATRWLSATTVFGPGSFEVCRRAAGQALAAANFVYSGQGRIAYALIRPPGHHAQADVADGYCFFNNIGVAIENLRRQGLRRAAVIDWDVHHGNGTQQGFYQDPDILTVSLHMHHGAWGDTHPQTGDVDEVGSGAGTGKNLNLPMPYGAGDLAYTRVIDEIVAPMVRAHKPEILFIAAGQDANQFDPNGRQLLSMSGFHELGQRARALADECCDGRLVLVQEGGYAVSYAAYCLHATLEGVLLRESELEDPLAYMREDVSGLDDFITSVRHRYDAAQHS
jgi:acetoin utilization deacetylase AcuC-like enzyme